MKALLTTIIILAAFGLSGCSDSDTGPNSTQAHLTAASTTGAVFACTNGNGSNQLVYNIDIAAGTMQYWQLEFGAVVSREQAFYQSSGILGATGYDAQSVQYNVTYFDSVLNAPLAPTGLLQDAYYLAIVNGTPNVVFPTPRLNGGITYHRCTPTEYSLATVGGVLIGS